MSAQHYPPVVESVDDPDVCEVHGCFAKWYDDGDPESGPGEPYPECPECRDEWLHPVLTCDVCGQESRSVKQGVTNERFDPTCYHVLACGHVVM
jgi:hypothetical protein